MATMALGQRRPISTRIADAIWALLHRVRHGPPGITEMRSSFTYTEHHGRYACAWSVRCGCGCFGVLTASGYQLVKPRLGCPVIRVVMAVHRKLVTNG